MVVVVLRAARPSYATVVIGKDEVRWQDVLFNQSVQVSFFTSAVTNARTLPLRCNDADDRSLSFLVRSASAALHSCLRPP
jgi:hypothetical protein